MMATSINYEGLPPVAPEFDAAALRANILDSQRNGQPYREFTRRAMAGGVQGYIAFLCGKRVTYWGRTGDQHTEWFPGVPCRTGHRFRRSATISQGGLRVLRIGCSMLGVECWTLVFDLSSSTPAQPASALIGDERQAPGQNSHIDPLKQRPFP